jgi:hypothetical protein
MQQTWLFLNNGLVDFTGIGINLNVIEAGRAESARNEIPAAGAPDVKYPAILTKTDIAAVAKNHTLLFLANLTNTCIVRNYHVVPPRILGMVNFLREMLGKSNLIFFHIITIY